MQLAHLSFPLPSLDLSPDLYLQLTSAFPRLKFSLPLDSLTPPTKDQLSALVVSHATVAATRGPDADHADFTLVLSGAALAEFLLTGHTPALSFALTYTSRPDIYDALVLDFPDEQLPFDPNKFLKALPDLPFPVIFKLTPANSAIFDIAIGFPEIMAIPLHQIDTSAGDIAFPTPYPDLPNGYQLDLSRTLPKEWSLYLSHFLRHLPETALIWFDWTWTAPYPSDYIPLLRSYYNLAAAHFDQQAGITSA